MPAEKEVVETVVSKLPELSGWSSVIWAFAVGMWSAGVRFFKVRLDAGHPIDLKSRKLWRDFFIEQQVGLLAGFVTWALASSSDMSQWFVIGLVAVSAHAGGSAMSVYLKIIEKRTGI